MVTEQERQRGQEAIVPERVVAPLPEQLSYSLRCCLIITDRSKLEIMLVVVSVTRQLC